MRDWRILWRRLVFSLFGGVADSFGSVAERWRWWGAAWWFVLLWFFGEIGNFVWVVVEPLVEELVHYFVEAVVGDNLFGIVEDVGPTGAAFWGTVVGGVLASHNFGVFLEFFF